MAYALLSIVAIVTLAAIGMAREVYDPPGHILVSLLLMVGVLGFSALLFWLF